MRELPEPKIEVKLPNMLDGDIEVIESFTRDQVLAIQKQAYEDGLRDAESLCEKNGFDDGFGCASLIRDFLKTSQE